MCYPDEMPEPIDDQPIDPAPPGSGDEDHPDGVPYEGDLC
jgi:hypothetical protein